MTTSKTTSASGNDPQSVNDVLDSLVRSFVLCGEALSLAVSANIPNTSVLAGFYENLEDLTTAQRSALIQERESVMDLIAKIREGDYSFKLALQALTTADIKMKKTIAISVWSLVPKILKSTPLLQNAKDILVEVDPDSLRQPDLRTGIGLDPQKRTWPPVSTTKPNNKEKQYVGTSCPVAALN